MEHRASLSHGRQELAAIEREIPKFIALDDDTDEARRRTGRAGWKRVSAARDSKRSPETGDLMVQIMMVAGARNPLNLEFSWAAA
jgi:hypothetical protein